ncbi:hypothetical protein ACLMJK_007421 [Lecanora helva]
MASVRSRAQLPVGSARWINDENDQVAQFCAQETEDFTFSARNEVEWLNEHMADIFSRNHKDITDCFKTPGKLRGKTPRTARKRNPLEAREPLTDVFAPNNRPNIPSPQKPSPSKPAPAFQVAEDPVAPPAEKKAPKPITDSGYHGLPEDEMEVDSIPAVPQSSAGTTDTMEMFPKSPQKEQQRAVKQSLEGSVTERSFHSAKENLTEKTVGENPQTTTSENAEVEVAPVVVNKDAVELDTNTGEDAEKEPVDSENVDKDLDEDLVVDESRTPSQGSSPPRPLARKSSLTFAPLPPRDFTGKQSLGARASQISHNELSKGNMSRGSLLDQFTSGKSFGGSKQPGPIYGKDAEATTDLDAEKAGMSREEGDTDAKMTQLHNKSSTQRLHDRINMLGQGPKKSIPASAATANPSYPELPKPEPQAQELQHIAGLASKAVALEVNEDDDDDWIQPPQEQRNAITRPQLPKSITADVMEDIVGKQTVSGRDFNQPRTDQQLNQQSSLHRPGDKEGPPSKNTAQNPAPVVKPGLPEFTNIGEHVETTNEPGCSTTPIGSPSPKRYVDGPLSASKSKLQSIMKSARDLFSSSAGVSAQAKLDTVSPTSMRTRGDAQTISTDGAPSMKPSQKLRPQSPLVNPIGRKTRSSTEKEQKRREAEEKEREIASADARREHEGEGEVNTMRSSMQAKETTRDVVQLHAKPTRQSPRRTQPQETQSYQANTIEDDAQVPPTSSIQGQPQGRLSHLQRPNDPRRPQKPTKETAPKTKPPPVAIKVVSQGMRMNNALSTNLQESLLPAQSKQQTVLKKPSNPTLHPSASNSSLKSSVSATTKPKALLAAERKKEQDEKEAQRKRDQKREIERKRAAQQEEARKQEKMQRQEAKRQREREASVAVEDPKLEEKKKAIEKRRMEMKKDQQPATQRMKGDPPHAPSIPRQDLGGPRPPSKLHNAPDHSRLAGNQPTQNPAKPPIKRVFDPDADEEPFRPGRTQGGPTYQANESKRRRTEDEDVPEVRVRPTMAPPIRQSGVRPGGMKPIFSHNNYAAAPPPASHHHNQPSLLKSTTANQAYQQHAQQNQISRPGHHPDIAKYQNGKIPFADNPNPPTHPSQTHKTPLQPNRFNPQQQLPTATAAKSSPHYPNGDNIHLDDIPTESESQSDSDSDHKKKPMANLPEWAQSPQLRELLMTQDENMDADAVFGPVQSPHMEEMFRERHHRFRSRTSSANWGGQDRLTEEEVRRDVEARRRLRREGGWRFDPRV